MGITINDPYLSFKSNMSSGNLPATTIYLHHAAGNLTAEQVHNLHLSKGWAGAGYHFYVHKDGSIWKLRPVEYVPAAHEPYNAHSIAISCQGNFDVETMSETQKNGIIAIVAWVKAQYPSVKYIRKHSDVSATACPGRYYPFDEIVQAVGLAPGGSAALGGSTGGSSGSSYPGKMYKVTNPMMHDDNVKAIQSALNTFGFTPGTVDGWFGPNTDKAVREFQRAKGLDADGIVGPDTWAALFSSGSSSGSSGGSGGDTDIWNTTPGNTKSDNHEPWFYKNNRQALQKSGMDITIDYGKGRIGEKIKGVYLRSKGVTYDASGNPLYEEFDFIARDVE